MDRFWIRCLAALAIFAGVSVAIAFAETAPRTVEEKTIALAEAFPGLGAAEAYTFRARKIELAPGARTELFRHEGRPSITYVTSGSVVETRGDGTPSIEHETGAAIFARAGVVHAWANASALPVTLLIVEVMPSP